VCVGASGGVCWGQWWRVLWAVGASVVVYVVGCGEPVLVYVVGSERLWGPVMVYVVGCGGPVVCVVGCEELWGPVVLWAAKGCEFLGYSLQAHH
jgi:hypothetical protein